MPRGAGKKQGGGKEQEKDSFHQFHCGSPSVFYFAGSGTS
jgi:hypothetical protein